MAVTEPIKTPILIMLIFIFTTFQKLKQFYHLLHQGIINSYIKIGVLKFSYNYI